MKRFAILVVGGLAACAHHDAASDPNVPQSTAMPSTPQPAGAANQMPESTGPLAPEPVAPATTTPPPINTAPPQATPLPTTAPPPQVTPPGEMPPPGTTPGPTATPERTIAEPLPSSGAPREATPLDQGNGTKDVSITAAIRRAVISDGSLSLRAKNVKIITNGGRVALRGEVKTEAERQRIEEKARAVDGVVDVDDRIEVKQ